jgi:hypothetical protein
MAIPWAVVGLIVAVANSHYRGNWIAAVSALCTVAGGVYSLVTHPFDGWLVWMMLGCCLGGAIAGLVLGVVVSEVAGLSLDSDTA